MTSAAERRKRIRVPVQSKLRHSQYQVLGTPVFQENTSIDISATGIAFQTEREYKKGNLVLLEVQVEAEQLKLLVCVAWVKSKSATGLYEVGAELIAVDPVDKRKMQTHLNRLIATVKKNKLAQKKSTSKKKAKKPAAKKTTTKAKKPKAKKTKAKKAAPRKKSARR